MRTAEVVIIGAGVVGASVAYHLAERGCRDVVVLETAPSTGAGSTGRATGGFRAQFATGVNVRLSMLSREKLLRFPEELGRDPGYRPQGYLFVAETAAEAAGMRAARAAQREAGMLDGAEIAPADVLALNPAARADDAAAAFFCPIDGFLRPMRILEGYLDGARRLGARVELGAGAVAFEKARDGRVAAVRTPRGAVAAGAVVNAAGAWAAEVGRLAGVDVPVAPVRRQMAMTHAFDRLSGDAPMVVFLSDSFHFRARDGRVVMGRYADTRAPRDPFDTRFDETLDRPWLDALLARVGARAPLLAEAGIDLGGCWAGLYEVSPDKHALLGRSAEVENFFLANGSSGHGVMHAPALGQLLAEIILDGRASSLDVAALRPSRFAEGAPNPGSEFL
jgi:sarcosine oxidase, subunit beta